MKIEDKPFNFSVINDPKYLADLSYDELDALCWDIRKYILDATSKNGGHLSSNLGSVESTVALCRVFDFSKDKIIFDVGHQCYTYKVLTGRSLKNLRQKGGTSGFQKRSESPYDCYECGHSSTSVSAAMGIAAARDLKKENYNIIAYIGDASFENGLVFEALNNLAKQRTKIIIVLNDNEMSIGKTKGGISKVFRGISNSSAYLRSKKATKKVFGITRFGNWILRGLSAIKEWLKRHLIISNIFDIIDVKYIGIVDGHDIKKMEEAFKKAKSFDGPVVVHIRTVKGKGFAYTENDKYGKYHGVGQFDEQTGELKSDPSLTTWSKEVSEKLYEVMKSDEKSVCICPATALGSELYPINKDFKNRFYDVEINEEHGVILAAGFSSNGVHPFISMYSTFMQRTYDEISHDLARMSLSATLLVDRAGLVGNDGDTHQGIYDSSFLYSIPNTVITMPSKPSQIACLLEESKKNHGVFAIRYPREKLLKTENIEQENIIFGEWKKELDGGKTALITYGPIIEEVKKVIVEKELKVTVFNAIYTRPILDENVTNLLDYDKIVIYDSYSTEVGFANSLVAKLIAAGFKKQIIVKAIPNVFVSHATINEQRDELGISIDKIIDILQK